VLCERKRIRPADWSDTKAEIMSAPTDKVEYDDNISVSSSDSEDEHEMGTQSFELSEFLRHLQDAEIPAERRAKGENLRYYARQFGI